jgi:hypothetical protein
MMTDLEALKLAIDAATEERENAKQKICKNCTFWGKDSDPLAEGYGICEKIDGEGKIGRDDIILDDIYEGRYLWTGENFGCVKFVEKSN